MWVSYDWSDYALLDCSEGERLERWGKYVVIRPDPQVIWHTPKNHSGWAKFDARYHRSNTGGGSWENLRLPQEWTISFENLIFKLRAMNFKHTGLFPEQAANWTVMRNLIKNAGRKIEVLNLFAYTGGATIACAKAGAAVCHVDAARGMVSVAKENSRLSGLENAPIRWIVDDCRKFIEREIRRGRKYDAIIMDPPSYGRGASGEIWRLEDDLYPFLSLAAEALTQKPLFVFINSYTTGLAPAVLKYLLQTVVCPMYGGKVSAGELGLPVENTELVLPCGATGRWTAAGTL